MQLAKPEGTAKSEVPPPGALTIAGLIVMTIVLIVPGTLAHSVLAEGSVLRSVVMMVIGNPPIALLIALAAWLLGIRRGWRKEKLEDLTGRAIPSSASVILVAGAGGAFGKALVESGVGKALAVTLETLHLPLVPAAFILSLELRASQGSATAAILTTSGLLSQAVGDVTDMQRASAAWACHTSTMPVSGS